MRGQIRDDIRTTSESIVKDARSDRYEEQKQEQDVTGEQLEELSEQAENIAHDMAHKASVEKRLVDVANAQDRLRQAGKPPE